MNDPTLPAESIEENDMLETVDATIKSASESIEPTVIFENIQALCKDKNISVSSMEVTAGVPTGTVPKWKKERHWMVYIQSVARTLNVSIDRLFLKDPTITTTEDDEKTRHLKLFNEIKKLNLDEKGTNSIIKIAKIFKETYKPDD